MADEEVFLRIVECAKHLGKRRGWPRAAVVVVPETRRALVMQKGERRRAQLNDPFSNVGLASLGSGGAVGLLRRHRAHERTRGVYQSGRDGTRTRDLHHVKVAL